MKEINLTTLLKMLGDMPESDLYCEQWRGSFYDRVYVSNAVHFDGSDDTQARYSIYVRWSDHFQKFISGFCWEDTKNVHDDTKKEIEALVMEKFLEVISRYEGKSKCAAVVNYDKFDMRMAEAYEIIEEMMLVSYKCRPEFTEELFFIYLDGSDHGMAYDKRSVAIDRAAFYVASDRDVFLVRTEGPRFWSEPEYMEGETLLWHRFPYLLPDGPLASDADFQRLYLHYSSVLIERTKRYRESQEYNEFLGGIPVEFTLEKKLKWED